MSRDTQAKRLYEADRARLVASGATEAVFPNVGKSWEEVDADVVAAYYGFVAEGDYEIEFEEDNND